MERGGLYDPTLLPDFDPAIFGLVSAKLAQQDVVGVDGNLVAPWDLADKLRPGTLVAIEANLIVYSFCKPSDPSTVSRIPHICDQPCSDPKSIQTFQLQVRRVQVLEESAAPATVRVTSAPVSPSKKSASGLFARLSKSAPTPTLSHGDSKVAESSRASTSRTTPADTPAAGPSPSKRVTRSK